MFTYIHSDHAVYSVEFTVYSVIRLLPRAICVCACGCSLFSPDWPSLNTTAIQGFCFVCLCLWHRCGVILLPPARLQPPSGPSSLSSIFTVFNASSTPRNLSASLVFHPFTSLVSPLSLLAVCNPTFFILSCPLSSPPSFCPPASDSVSHSISYWLVLLSALWPCCNSARKVTADRFLWKRHCHVR